MNPAFEPRLLINMGKLKKFHDPFMAEQGVRLMWNNLTPAIKAAYRVLALLPKDHPEYQEFTDALALLELEEV